MSTSSKNSGDACAAVHREDTKTEINLQTKVQEESFCLLLSDRRLTSLNPCLYLQGEGELQVGLCQPR